MSIEKLKIINLVKVEFMAEQCYGVTLDRTDLHDEEATECKCNL